MPRLDLHMHTAASRDGYITLKRLDALCQKHGVDQVAICDHDEISGALKAMKALSVTVIPGEEVATREGEIIGLFLSSRIPPGMSMAETIAAIKEQGGLVYLEHPFGYGQRAHGMDIRIFDELWDAVDIVEVFNARNLLPSMNEKALALAREKGKPMAVGSDAHFPLEFGRTYQDLPPWEGPEGLVAALNEARLVTRRCPLAYRFFFKFYKTVFSRPPGP